MCSNVVITDMCILTDEEVFKKLPKDVYNIPNHVSVKEINTYPRQITKTMDTATKYAYAVAKNILENNKSLNKSDIGLILGSTVANNDINNELTTSNIFKSLSCSPAINVAHALELSNMVIGSSAACGTSLQALALGYMAITSNMYKAVLVGGCDEVSNDMINIFLKLGLLTKDKCKPFKPDRSGTKLNSIGGASLFLLENYESYKNRDEKKLYGKVIGIGMSCSNSLARSTSESIVKCMQQAYNQAICKEHKDINIDILVAHGTGTVIGDRSELKAIYNSEIPIKNIVEWKSYLGHTLAASGLVDLAFTLTNVSYYYSTYIMANNFGLGGINTSVIIKLRN